MRVPSTADLAMPRVGDDAYLAAIDHAAPELQRSPRNQYHEKGIGEAPPSRLGASRAVDRAQGGAALVRARQWIKRRTPCACPQLLILQCRALAMTPYLAAIDHAAPELQAFAPVQYHGVSAKRRPARLELDPVAVDRAQGGTWPLVRARQWIKRGGTRARALNC